LASITERPRKRLTPTPRRDAVRAYHRRLARKARAARRQIEHNHSHLPKPVHTVFAPLAPALTRPTYHRLVLLALAAILTVGGRTVANLLRYRGALAPGHSSSYHRVLSHRRWSAPSLARR
jgi:hypothetical protein